MFYGASAFGRVAWIMNIIMTNRNISFENASELNSKAKYKNTSSVAVLLRWASRLLRNNNQKEKFKGLIGN
jgi:hypothetical protein